MNSKSGAICAGSEEHRVAKTEETGIAEENIVADRKHRIDHDAREIAHVVGGQQILQQEQAGDDEQVKRHRPGSRFASCGGLAGKAARPRNEHQCHEKCRNHLGERGRKQD